MSNLVQFPESPVLGQVYVFKFMTWKWDGVAWTQVSAVEQVQSDANYRALKEQVHKTKVKLFLGLNF
jgi:hypothetical protein